MSRDNSGRIHYRLESIPSGLAGTDATVKRMAQLVNQAVAAQWVRVLALQILGNAQFSPGEQLPLARALFEWVRSTVRYVRDPVGLETVQAPEVTLKLRAGDCDDSSTLLAALLTSVGLKSRWVTVGPDAHHAQHIYTQVFINGDWLNADTTTPGPLGKPNLQLPAVMHYSVRGERMNALGAPDIALSIPRETLWRVAYIAAKKKIRDNWRDGLINRADIEGYIQVIDQGNSPYRGTFADGAMRQAAVDVLAEKNLHGESAPKGEMAELGEVGFFLGSVVSFVGKAIGGAVKAVTGGQAPQIIVNPPTINIPSISTQVSPDTARAGVGAFLTNPVVLVGGALALILLMRR